MIWQWAASIAIVAFASGATSASLFGSPFPQIHTRGEIIGGLLIVIGFVALVVAMIAGIWRV